MPKKFIPYIRNFKGAIKMKICAIVVTYNRKKMLESCLRALLGQDYKDFDIIIVDNASTDGTAEFVEPYLSDKVKYLNTGSNLGGSGGFYYGLKYAYRNKYDWIWIMDDDVMPTTEALSELLNALKYAGDVSFLASAVYSQDGNAMNTPEVSKYSTNGYKFWYEKLEYGMVRIMHATFVSLLINRKAIEKCGLPCKDYFIWGDDTEYTMRIIGSYGSAYFVGKSKVYHLRSNASTLSIMKESNPARISMYYYMVRNTLVNAHSYFGEKSEKNFKNGYLRDCRKLFFSNDPYKTLKIETIKKGIHDYKKGNYNVKAFKNRYEVFGQEDGVFSFIGAENIRKVVEKTFGYDVSNVFEGFSVFTAFEPVPAYIKESELPDCSVSVKQEIRRTFLSKVGNIIKNEYFVFDFLSSLGRIGEFSDRNVTFSMNFTKEFEADYNSGKIGFGNEYKLSVTALSAITEERMQEAILSFVTCLMRVYSSSNIIMVKQPLSEIEGETNKRMYITLCKEFVRRMPQCKILEIPERSDVPSVDIKSLIDKTINKK